VPAALEPYQDYADVFSEEKARRFPSEREEDHEIKFAKEIKLLV